MKFVKIVVTVPVQNADEVRTAVGDAGAGELGSYTHASFSTRGTGRFLPGVGAHPAIGEIGKEEAVEEERIEWTCEADKVKAIIAAIRSVHPYEVPAIDVYALEAT